MQIFDVLRMQISSKEYLNPKLTSFQIMTSASIWSTKTKVENKKHEFFEILQLANVTLGSNATFYKTTFINFSISISYELSKLLVILQNPNKL